MIKSTYVMGAVLLAVLAFAVFQVEYYVQGLETELEQAKKQLSEDRETIHVLRAEWAYLNQPERLRDMVAKHLHMETVNVAQLRDIRTIPLHTITVSQAMVSP